MRPRRVTTVLCHGQEHGIWEHRGRLWSDGCSWEQVRAEQLAAQLSGVSLTCDMITPPFTSCIAALLWVIREKGHVAKTRRDNSTAGAAGQRRCGTRQQYNKCRALQRALDGLRVLAAPEVSRSTVCPCQIDKWDDLVRAMLTEHGSSLVEYCRLLNARPSACIWTGCWWEAAFTLRDLEREVEATPEEIEVALHHSAQEAFERGIVERSAALAQSRAACRRSKRLGLVQISLSPAANWYTTRWAQEMIEERNERALDVVRLGPWRGVVWSHSGHRTQLFGPEVGRFAPYTGPNHQPELYFAALRKAARRVFEVLGYPLGVER